MEATVASLVQVNHDSAAFKSLAAAAAKALPHTYRPAATVGGAELLVAIPNGMAMHHRVAGPRFESKSKFEFKIERQLEFERRRRQGRSGGGGGSHDARGNRVATGTVVVQVATTSDTAWNPSRMPSSRVHVSCAGACARSSGVKLEVPVLNERPVRACVRGRPAVTATPRTHALRR